MAPTQQLEDAPAEAAIEWMVEIGSGEMSHSQIRAFEAWLSATPANEAAWLRLQEGLMPCGVAARRNLGRKILARHSAVPQETRRTFIVGFAGLIGTSAIGAGIADRFVPLGNILADHITHTGGQKTVALADGSELVLSTRTALDIVYEPGLRAVHLWSGEVLVRAASRATPFQVRTGPLTLTTSAGAFLVESGSERLAVTGINGFARIAHASDAVEPITTGELVEFADGHSQRKRIDVDAATAWLGGLLMVKDSELSSIATKLQRYFSGIIQVDPAVANLRATGVFSLRNPNAALDALAESLDLSLTRISPLWIKLGPSHA